MSSRKIGSAAGLDVAAALRERDAPDSSVWLAAAQRDADRLRIEGTPAFSLRIGDGRPIPLQAGALTPESFAVALDAAL